MSFDIILHQHLLDLILIPQTFVWYKKKALIVPITDIYYFT